MFGQSKGLGGGICKYKVYAGKKNFHNNLPQSLDWSGLHLTGLDSTDRNVLELDCTDRNVLGLDWTETGLDCTDRNGLGLDWTDRTGLDRNRLVASGIACKTIQSSLGQ